MATMVGLTPRQFERRFVEHVGVSPKLYARIIRFNAALDCKLAHPHRTWTQIAHALHYYDQMHMVHDFHDLASASPTQFLARLTVVPEFRTSFATDMSLGRSR